MLPFREVASTGSANHGHGDRYIFGQWTSFAVAESTPRVLIPLDADPIGHESNRSLSLSK